MEYTMKPYIVYVKTNSDDYIIAINSSAFLADSTGWIEIDSGYGDKYHHAQGNYLPKPICNMKGIYRYRLVDNIPVECSEEEINEQEEATISTQTSATTEERIEALEAAVTMLCMPDISEV